MQLNYGGVYRPSVSEGLVDAVKHLMCSNSSVERCQLMCMSQTSSAQQKSKIGGAIGNYNKIPQPLPERLPTETMVLGVIF